MLRELSISSRHYHDEYIRRHIKPAEPLPPAHEWRRAIGHSLIHLGERLANVEQTPRLHEAA